MQAGFHSIVPTNAPNIDGIGVRSGDRHGIDVVLRIILNDDARGLSQGRLQLSQIIGLFKFQVNAFTMAIIDRNTDGSRRHPDGGVMENFMRLIDHLHFLFGIAVIQEHVDMG